MGHMRIYTPKCFVQKIAKNCNFFEEIAENRGNSAIYAQIMGDIAANQGCTKIAKN